MQRKITIAIEEFITEEWGENVSTAFVQKTKDFFDLLELFPELGSMELPEKRIRRFQLTNQTGVTPKFSLNEL